ncbi:MAG: branched-chain amino acid ABC transporter permease [Alphaproteobacteria bacterium]
MGDLVGIAAYLTFFLAVALNYAVACLGLNLQWGYTGLFNVGVAGFYAVGAYAGAILSGPDFPGQVGGFGLPFPLAWAGAMLVTGAVALVVAVPTLRLRHDYLAIATFGIAVVIQLVALNAQWLTGGAFGINAPRPMFETIGSPFTWNLLFLAVTVLVVAILYIALERLAQSPWGRVLRAIREDETAARALGKSATAFRIQAFVLGCMIIGLAGAMFVSFVGFVSAQDFLPILTFQVWTMLIVGGSGNNRGAILGAIVVWALWTLSGRVMGWLLPPEMQVRGAALQIVLIGVVLAALLIFRPGGILGERTAISRHLEPGRR